jgi:hypothetical protein
MVVAQLPFDKAKELGKGLASRIAEDGISHDVFHDWVGDDADRESFLAHSVWGMIRWDKALGRPDGTLASGFAVTHKARRVSVVVTANGADVSHAWIAQDDVVLYDLPDDGDTHRVGFSCRDDDHPPYTGDNLLTAAFAPNHRWISKSVSVHNLPLHLWIEPWGWDWQARHAPVILDAFVVK